jgi:hypothetical protein
MGVIHFPMLRLGNKIAQQSNGKVLGYTLSKLERLNESIDLQQCEMRNAKCDMNLRICEREMVGTLLMFFWYPHNYDVAFKIINRLKVNNDTLKFNDNFKSHITVGRIPGEY